MMEERILKCSLITPMYSYGAYQGRSPEVRVTELKGMMRYVYRIVCPFEKVEQLKKAEEELFGGAAETKESECKHASPVRLLIRAGVGADVMRVKEGKLLLHKDDHNPEMKHFESGSFTISVRLNPYISKLMEEIFPMVDLTWYVNFIELTLVLCGLGKRSRKGRGSVAIEGRNFANKKEALEWILSMLNQTASFCSDTAKADSQRSYILDNNEIHPEFSLNKFNRPVIQKICMGNSLEKEQIADYMWAVDDTCHDEKDKYHKEQYQMATGSGRPRFASPLILSFVQTQEGIYPMYIFVKPICGDLVIDRDKKIRENFIKSVEQKWRKKNIKWNT